MEPLYELLIEEDDAFSTSFSFGDLCDYGGMETVEQCWKLYKALKSSFFFQQQGEMLQFTPRSQDEITKLTEKSLAKEREEELRGAFIQRLKNRQLELPGDYQLMQDAIYQLHHSCYLLIPTHHCVALPTTILHGLPC